MLFKCKHGNKLRIDEHTHIDFLWPKKDLIHENVLNNNSIVCKLSYRSFSILFTGDIEEIAEKQIVNLYSSSVLNSKVLKVAHHGSKSSSIDAFISKVNPQITLIGVGENNKFGHPNDAVIERLQILRSKDL